MDGALNRSSVPRFLSRVAVVRLLLFFLMLATTDVGVQIALTQAVKHVPSPYIEGAAVAGAFGACIVLAAVYASLVWSLERRRPRELALLPGAPLAVAGVLFGFMLFAVVYAVLWALGVAHWQGFAGYAGIVRTAIPAMIAAVGEELAIRGGVFRILEDGFGTLVALVLSAALFGLLHALNPGATAASTAAIALEAGLLLGAAYAVTRNLWFPIGLHFGWNFTEGGVFGAAVSGGEGGHGIVRMSLNGPDLLTGGAFGPEASLVAVAICLAAAVVLLAAAIRRRHWVRLSFNMILD
ncbi:MAG: CPBP family intramembrane metalloprotease [Alphaproteobacteria bacterium]|nr:CPBP family intramembrane metalloprotease [Alphaproteobacteria bacterium]